MAAARVIVTRPASEARRWVELLQQRGLAAQALPLIDIAAAPEASDVAAAWHRLDRYHAVMFVSGNAVQQFFALCPEGAGWGHRGDAGPRAWATGPGTALALRQAGVAGSLIDAPDATAAQFDSEALWKVVGHELPAQARVLIVRGADASGQSAGRHWLSDRLTAAGAVVDLVTAYVRRAPQWDPVQTARAQTAVRDGSVWLFSSSEALAHLRQLMPGQDWAAERCVATHPRIAQAATELGFGVVCVSRPDLDDLVASIESCR